MKCYKFDIISKCIAAIIVFTVSSLPLYGQELGLDERINDAFMPFAVWWENFVMSELPLFGHSIPFVLIILLSGATLFTIFFGGINVRRFFTAIRVVRGHYDHLEPTAYASEEVMVSQVGGDILDTIKDESHTGEVNHFQALATAVSGTVGLGNIAMVAVAISIGGPGATFWMIVAGLLGMSSKFVECTLGVKYRDVDADGKVYGGPMYYLSKGLSEQGREKLGKVLSFIFAVLCVGASFGGGNAFQSNQASAQLIRQFGLEASSMGTILGLIFAMLVGIVIIGGIKRIARVTEKVVPFMAFIYVAAALYVLVSNVTLLDEALLQIISEAFSPRATVAGGFIWGDDSGFSESSFLQ